MYLAATAPLGVVACGNPCQDLGHAICNCEATAAAQQNCTANVDNEAKNQSPSKAQQQCCSALLNTCTCDQLADGNLAACGLAQNANSNVPAGKSLPMCVQQP
jgi:hypothetical protein